MRVNGRHLVGPDGQPFFWLADTAWNLWCKGTPEEWDRYLAHRKAQGFNVIQFVMGWWRGCMQPIHGRPFDVVNGELIFNEAVWESLDQVMHKIREHGLIASPIMLWTLTDIDPGQVLTEEQCIAVAKKQLERYSDPNIVWMLGGDGNYTSPEVTARWKRIGRAVFGEHPPALATLHPCGTTWSGEDFADEPWYQLAAIQSGHGTVDRDLEFLVKGPWTQAWPQLEMPLINLEPNYENAVSYEERVHLHAYHVRRASYWSLLVVPPAGVTYGIGSIWIWSQVEGEIAENHDDSWVGRPWHEDLETPGAHSMMHLKHFFEGLPWTHLYPAPEMLAEQPGEKNPNHWQAAAATHDRSVRVIYSPTADPVQLAEGEDAAWRALDPATMHPLMVRNDGGQLHAEATSEGDVLFVTP